MQTQSTATAAQPALGPISPPPPGMDHFDLERARNGATLRTRDGTPAELVEVVDDAPPTFRIRVKLPQYQHPRTYCENGAYHSDGRADGIDLFLAKA
jgi:hypothetical protein